jgi:hypothetical protein
LRHHLYLFATTQIPRWSAVVVAYAYLLYAPLHGPNFLRLSTS